ncbi:MAG TPA: response regulator transcription factor [Gaiellaceae bacterium]|nr:response regulator transcription factor [Gaiellaceae bacterium]
MSSSATSVLVVDDDPGFREGLEVLLAGYGFDVLGTAADGEAAVGLVRELVPDVVLMDLHMPGISGVEATKRIAESSPLTAVLILTVSATETDVLEAMLAGGRGYLVKGSSPETVVGGIQAAARGETIISSEVALRLFATMSLRDAPPAHEDPPTALLSAREVEILRLLASGRHNEEIASQLVISPFTVRNHVSNLLRKLQLENRTQAAAYAARHYL